MGLNEVMSRLPAKTRERMKKAADIEIKLLQTPSPKLDKALGGGLPYGRQVMIWGQKASGKSTFCLQTIANAQAQGEVCVYIDAERTFDPSWAAQLGVDVDELQVIDTVNRVSEMSDTVCDLMTAGVRVIVVDSINGLIPDTQFKDGELVALLDPKHNGSQGQFARSMAEAVGRMNAVNHDTLLILISQGRMQTAGRFWVLKPTGGYAVMYNSSTVIKLHTSASDLIQEEYPMGNTVLKQDIGRKVTWTVEQHKTGRPMLSGSYDLRFVDPVGIDKVGDLVDICIENGLIAKAGAWLKYDGQNQSWLDSEVKWNGRAKAVDALRKDEKMQHELREELYVYSG